VRHRNGKGMLKSTEIDFMLLTVFWKMMTGEKAGGRREKDFKSSEKKSESMDEEEKVLLLF
jgi:hypothetical protein